jgi:hypothetical protein
MAEINTSAGGSATVGQGASANSSAAHGGGQTESGHATAGFASTIVDKVRDQATAQLSTQKDRAFEGIGNVAQAVRQSTQQLRDQHHETLAGYVEQAADQIDRFAQQLRSKDVTELLDDAQRLARRQPALFVGSAFAVGLIGARFLKSSTRPTQSGGFRGHASDSVYGGGYQATGERGGYASASSGAARDLTRDTHTVGQSAAQYGRDATPRPATSTNPTGSNAPSQSPSAQNPTNQNAASPGVMASAAIAGSSPGQSSTTGANSSPTATPRGRAVGKPDTGQSASAGSNASKARRSGSEPERS